MHQMISQDLTTKYSNLLPFLVKVKERVSQTIAVYCDSEGFPYYGRIKSPESVSEKIETARFASFSEIDDLVAFTIIIPNSSCENDVYDQCRNKFNIHKYKSKDTARKSPLEFRFDATRLVCTMRMPADLEYSSNQTNSIYNIKFEIQIRTAFEHAWSVATHDIVYKGSDIDWRRIRLSSQLKAISEGLDASIAGFDTISNSIVESPDAVTSEQKMVCDFVSFLFSEINVPRELYPLSITRTSENISNLIRIIRPRITLMQGIGDFYKEIMKLETIPISITLLQLWIALLSRAGRIQDDIKIACHITPELAKLFPEVRNIQNTFTY